MTAEPLTADPTPASSPTHLMELFARRAADGDVAGLVALYEPDGVLQPQPGVRCTGHEEIRAALTEMVTIRPQITYLSDHDVVLTGDIALVSGSWVMTGRAPDGVTVREGGISADVLRRQPDGTWRVLIDQPRGEPLPA